MRNRDVPSYYSSRLRVVTRRELRHKFDNPTDTPHHTTTTLQSLRLSNIGQGLNPGMPLAFEPKKHKGDLHREVRPSASPGTLSSERKHRHSSAPDQASASC